MAHNADEIREELEKIIDDFALRGLRAIGVCKKEGEDGKWEFIELGVRVKMITGDQVAIGRETARRLGMGMNFHNAKVVRSDFVDGIPIADIIEEADGFGEVFPEDKYEVVKTLRKTKNGPHGGVHVVGMTGDGVNDAPALKAADVGIAVADATDAARSAADMVLLTPGLYVIIDAIIGSRKIFQRMKNYSTYAAVTTIRIVTTFALMACIWEFSFPPFAVLIIVYFNDGTILTISKDRASPSPTPDAWRLQEIFTNGFFLGLYLTVSTLAMYAVLTYTTWVTDTFHLDPLIIQDHVSPRPPGFNTTSEYSATAGFCENCMRLNSIIYLQVSITGQMVIFSTRARTFWFTDLPSYWLMGAFVFSQLCATLLAVYADWPFTAMGGIGWGYAGFVWVWSICWFIPIDLIKIAVHAFMYGNPWKTIHSRQMYNLNINGGASHMRSNKRAPNSRAYALASNRN